MHKTIRFAVLLAVTAALLAPAGASAAKTLRVSSAVDETFYAPGLSELCGVPVWIHVEGEYQVTYFYDASGTQIVRELDYAPATKTTIFSPVQEGGTGRSFTSPISYQMHVSYPEGITVGSKANIVVTGVSGFAAPGYPGAGRIVYEGVVVDTSDGLPHLDWPTAMLSIVGSYTRGLDPIALRCAYLAGQ